MADKTSADCLTTYHASGHSGTRDTNVIKWVVLHSTESPADAKGIAHYFASPGADGSAHLVVDDNHCYRTLADNEIPWAAPGANTNGFHIEQCGYAAWTPEQWKAHSKTLLRAAYKTAYHCHKFHIPTTFVDAAGLKAGKKGITTHAEVSKAFPNDKGNHHDPGTNWPRAYFMAAVRRYYKQLGA